MREMTITEGLVELKLLDKRIHKAIGKNWVTAVVPSGTSEEMRNTFSDEVSKAYQSVKDLITERNRIKSAIVKSNAITEIKVADEPMTVAEAIERKTSIQYEKDLLSNLRAAYANANNAVTQGNARAQAKIDQMLENMAGSDKSDIAEAQKVIMESYMEKNGWELLDPLNVQKEIEALDKKIDEFEKNVDLALSVSNAVTRIEV